MASNPGASATTPATDTASITGFATKLAAENHANDIESDQRRNTWLDPARGKTTLGEWVTI